MLRELGFEVFEPHGAYYVMTDISGFGYGSDVEFADYLVRDVGVATVPGSSFYHDPALGQTKIRFAYPKRLETLERAADLLKTLVRLPASEGQSRAGMTGSPRLGMSRWPTSARCGLRSAGSLGCRCPSSALADPGADRAKNRHVIGGHDRRQ